MIQMKYTMLISALAVASLLAAGCEQRASGDKVGQATSPSTTPSRPATTSPPMTSSDQTSKTSGAVDDTMLTAKVKAALLAEPGLKSTQIDVATKDATVTLSGNVDSSTMRDRAKQVAMGIDGVKDVVDNMNLKTTS